MNQILKSFFIGLYPLLALFGIVLAIDQYIHQFYSASIGLFLLSLPIIIFLGIVFLTDVARTKTHLTPYSVIVLIGTAILGYAFGSNDAEPMAALGFVLSLCWFLYVYWYSTFGDRTNAILTSGQMLPNLALETDSSESFTLDNLKGKKSIIMFYRGNWCPLCMTQIKELANSYKVLESKGIQTVLVSPQPHNHTKRLAKKYNIGFQFLVDRGNQVAKELNIIAKNGLPTGLQVLGYDSDTVMPTIILTDPSNTIIHSDLTSNYRVRPEPDELIKYFE